MCNVFSSGRLEVCLMGCQDLLESLPGSAVLVRPGSLSETKSLKVRAGLSGRSGSSKAARAEDLTCKSPACSNVMCEKRSKNVTIL